MLARTFFVRKLIPADQAKFDAAPLEYSGDWVSNPDGDVGEAVSEQMHLLNDAAAPGGIRFLPLLGIIWSKTARPAMTYEDPTFLENVDDFVEGYIEERVEERLAEYDDEDDEGAED